ncbi:beta-ketoacyl synthase N-terminal-like domain-containing protein [Pseudoalteromonas luteoviolacea]|nr:beta-ketoacyl synthase N-terminal-like domain-containing protein [Pseudoalteromonas luteoviolacea]
MCIENNKSSNASDLFSSAESYVVSIVSKAVEGKDITFNSETSFGDFGVDSFHVLKIVKRLEEDFGRLPKTLLFEFINIKELTSYLLDSHKDTFLSLLGSTSTATPDDLAHSDSERADANAPVANIEAQAPTSPQTRSEEEVEVKVDTSPILIDDLNQIDDAAIATVIAQLNAAYKNEGTISRGTSKIAPTLFLGSCQRGYFNLGKKGELVLAYSYTGAVDGFDDVLLELTNYCKRHALKLNIMSDDSIHQTGDIQFTSTPFGAVQRVLNLQNFSLGGGKMRRLRYLVSKYEKVGEAKTVEYISGSDPDTDAQIGVVIDRWCELKTKVNPLVEKAKSDIVAGKLDASHRLFITYLDGAISNVILITAIQVPGNGYLMDLEFYAADMPLGGLEYAISQIIEQLITEGCELFSLGATLGPKLSPSENMDPDLDGMLDILRAQDIFDDQGNLQFKNKFRPENKTIFLSRPADYQAADDVIDVILMIAEPGQPEVFPVITATDEVPLTVEDVSATVTVATAADETPSSATPIINTPVRAEPISEQQTQELIKACQQLGSRGKALVEAGFNVANVAAKSVEHDLKTDSWAKSSYPFIEQHVSGLHKHIQKANNVHKQLATVFPFEHIICTKSGASAEAILCKAWPQKGVVLQNILFPTFIYSLLDNGFTPVELPHADIYDLNRASEHKAHIDITRLLRELDAQAQPVSFVGIEISNNASGGNAVSLGHLAELKKHLAARNIPLVMDATRIMENALNAPDGDASASIWQRARSICAHADVVTASLAKDFGINRGGILATNDPQLFKRFQDEADKSIDRMGLIDKKLVSLALADQEAASERLHTRQKQLATLRNTLTQAGIPLVQSSNAHCVLIDVKKLDSYAALAYPVESFLASLYLNAGIQAAGHNVGMQRDTALNNLVRVALPLGLSDHELNTIAHKMVDALSSPRHIVDINRVDADNGAFLSMGASYTPVRLLNAGGDDASSEAPSRDAEAVTTSADVASQNTASHTPNKEVVVSVSNAPQARDSEVGDIAIIGMAGRYPGADNLDQLWQNLVDSKDCITDIPQDRLDKRTASHKASYRGGFINNVDKFDSLFFNISPREAEMLDPQERLMLETAWEALEDGGYYPELLQNADGQNGKVGVFVGGVWSMYQILGVEQKMAGNPVTPNSFMWSLANRISYWMNLTGPSLTIDTACSSSLTAMYYACQSINKGDCQSAIVGGVNLDIHQHKYDINHNGGALSEDGVCRSFGANANGYVAGEGVNALYLKPLKQAIADKDNIHGVIRGIGVNHGGRTNGYTVPSPKSQANLISDVLAEAQINAATIGYVEAHGTGTELGDPIEITGLTRAFSADNVPAQSCAIGSIKTNIGHLEAAAGIAGVTKALLQMKHKTLVPSLHSAQLNEHIDFASSPFEVQQILAPWQPASLEGVEQPLRASISSFGAGGANAHLVIEAYNPVDTEAKSNDATLRLFPLSARTAQQLTQQAQRLLHFLEQDTPPPRLADIAFTLQMGRKAFDHRLAILASSQQQLIERLLCFIDTQAHSDVIVANTKDSKRVSGLLSTQENAEIIDMIASKGDPRKIATLWAEGFVDDLQFIKTDSPQRRVSLPLYPFADKRHWIEAHEAPLGTLDSIHPNIDSNESTFNAQVFTKSFTAKDFCIYDHLVSNIPTLPGVAYLDMARVTAEQALNRPVHKVYNVIWVSPLTVDGQNTTEAKVELIPKGNSVNFEIYGEADDQTRKVYCQGKIAYRGSASEEIPEEYIDIDAVKSRSALVAKGAESYPQFHELGLQLGPSFQVLQDVYKNDDEILGELQIPACRRDDFNRFILHPSLMDGSLQAGMAASLGAQSGTMYVPYSIGEVEVYHPLTERCFSYIQKVNEPHSKLSKANVTIVDETGRVLVKIKESIGVPLVDVHEKPSETASSVAETNEFEPLYYAYDWSEAELDCTAEIRITLFRPWHLLIRIRRNGSLKQTQALRMCVLSKGTKTPNWQQIGLL